jgi:hypothetical protein
MNGRLNDKLVVTRVACLRDVERDIARRPPLDARADQMSSLASIESTYCFPSCSVLKLGSGVRSAGDREPGLDCGGPILTATGTSRFVSKETGVCAGDSRGDL